MNGINEQLTGTNAPASPWRSMFEESTLGIARADLTGRFLDTNRAYSKLSGYSNSELRTLTLLDLVVEDNRSAHAGLMEELRHGERQDFQIEARYRRQDGQIVWIHNTVSLIPGESESSNFVMMIAKDITARRLASASLNRQNEALKKIFDHVPVMISLSLIHI